VTEHTLHGKNTTQKSLLIETISMMQEQRTTLGFTQILHTQEVQQSEKTKRLPSSMFPMPVVSGATCLLLEPGPPPSTFRGSTPFCHGAAVPFFFLALLQLLPDLRNIMPLPLRSVPLDGYDRGRSNT